MPDTGSPTTESRSDFLARHLPSIIIGTVERYQLRPYGKAQQLPETLRTELVSAALEVTAGVLWGPALAQAQDALYAVCERAAAVLVSDRLMVKRYPSKARSTRRRADTWEIPNYRRWVASALADGLSGYARLRPADDAK